MATRSKKTKPEVQTAEAVGEGMRRRTFHQYGPDIAKVVQLRSCLTRQINKRAAAEAEQA